MLTPSAPTRMNYAVRERWTSGSVEKLQGIPYGFPASFLPPVKEYTFTTVPSRYYYEVITPNSSSDHNVWKDFQHYKCSFEISDGMFGPRHSEGWFGSIPNRYYYVFEHKDTLAGWTTGWTSEYRPQDEAASLVSDGWETGTGDLVPLPTDYGMYVNRALASMMPGIRAQLSLLNSIYELKDFRSLPKLVANIGAFPRFLIANQKFRQRGTMAFLSDLSADVFLQQQFNILPLITDIMGVYSVISSTEERLRKLLNEIGKPQRRHFVYRCTVGGEHTYNHYQELGGPDNSPWPPYSISTCKIYQSSTWLEFRGELEYTYSIPEYQVVHARLLAYLDALGVQLNPAIIWNAIPWSFVIDWVAGVSQWLSGFKVPNLNPIVNIRRACFSVKTSRTFDATHSVGINDSLPYSKDRPMPRVTETAYRRDVRLPSANSFLTSGISSKEFILGGVLAFVVSKRRYHKQRAIRLIRNRLSRRQRKHAK